MPKAIIINCSKSVQREQTKGVRLEISYNQKLRLIRRRPNTEHSIVCTIFSS